MKVFLLKIIPGIILLAIWQYFAAENKEISFLFSSPLQILTVLFKEIQTFTMWQNIGVTLAEASLGLILGTFFGTMFGLLIWLNETLRKISEPYLAILGAIPIFALAPMLIVWFGIGLFSKVIMAAFSVFLVALSQSYEGTKIATGRYTIFAKSLGVPRRVMMFKIILPGSLQWILSGIKMNIGLALLGAFIGEFVSSTAGLGFYILREGSLFNIAGVWVGIILLTFLSVCLNAILKLITKSFMPWLNY